MKSTWNLGVEELDELLQTFIFKSSASVSAFYGEDNGHPDHASASSTTINSHEDVHGNNGAARSPFSPDTGSTTPPVVHISSEHPVVELSSFGSGAGKSQLLCYIVATAILPERYNEVQLRGQNAAVVYIDTDGRFDANRLRTVARGIVQQRLDAAGTYLNAETVESLLHASLKHVHVIRPQSSLSLLATLQRLDAYLLDLKSHFSSSRRLHSVVVDSATAFIWQDRLRDDIARIEEIGRPYADVEHERSQKKSFQLGLLYAELTEELKRLQRKFGCSVIFTCLSWGSKKTTTTDSETINIGSYSLGAGIRSEGPSLRSPLPSPWGIFPHLRLIVQRDVVFLPTSRRAEGVGLMRGSKFSARVNGWDSEGWPSGVVEALKRRDAFSFHADGAGVRLSVGGQ